VACCPHWWCCRHWLRTNSSRWVCYSSVSEGSSAGVSLGAYLSTGGLTASKVKTPPSPSLYSLATQLCTHTVCLLPCLWPACAAGCVCKQLGCKHNTGTSACRTLARSNCVSICGVCACLVSVSLFFSSRPPSGVPCEGLCVASAECRVC
jgi:hypothetical protein